MSSLNLEPNRQPPMVMHIDLNSAFAMTEQQANPLLRGRPVGVTNRLNDYAICIAASYEAKRAGIGLGTRRPEAMVLAPNFVMVESDPAKYQYVHQKLQAIFSSYSPTAYMKSVDEGIIDFTGMEPVLKGRPLEDIAQEIKTRIKTEIGNYLTVNTGIAQNRWLAKLAAGFLKPNGLYTIDHSNLEIVYGLLDLVELPYIKQRMRARLNNAGIFTTLDFFRAPESVLVRQVFQSINGHLWYLKLRGYETEVPFGIRTVSRNYVLEHRTSDPAELAALLYKASVKVARRLQKNDFATRGIMLWLMYKKTPSGPRYFFQRQMFKAAARRADQIYSRALHLFSKSPAGLVVTGMALTAYALEPAKTDQPPLFVDNYAKREALEDSINYINSRYGELTVAPGTVVKSKNPMKDKVPFGSIRYFE